MLLIVDGYNVLKQAKGAQATESEKQAFIKRLVQYSHEKNHEAILVFDGGHSFYPSKEHQGNVAIVYAGIHQSADDYIKKVLEKEKERELLLVSSDNELCFFAHRREIASIDALAFFRLMHAQGDGAAVKHKESGVQKFSTTLSRELDEIMEEESKKIPLKKEEEVRKRESKQQKKKYEKALLKKIKKL